ncbi:MAG: hypothetical protein VKP62_02580 [Candidatus Sericytochromatia bacterium]|nr:hypothetical protein [Candidatus Sericytochromatia bacterium]
MSFLSQLRAFALLTTVAFSAGCTFNYSAMREAQIGHLQLAPLTPDQYEIVGDVKGSGKATYFLFFELNNQTQYEGEFLPGGWGFKDWFLNSAYRMAHFQAIKSAAGADALVAPRYEVQTWGAPGILTTTTVTVYAKAIRLKATRGAELPASPKP